MPFTDAERQFLAEQRLGRIATSSAAGVPDVAPVTFELDGEAIRITGMDITKTRKYHNVRANPQASFVVDDLVSVDPWTPRGLKVTGTAQLVEDRRGRASLRIDADTIWSWGLNQGADKAFGPIEKRPA